MARIESLLSARSFLAPQLVDDRIFFLSNLSGHISLYAMDFGGSVPEPLMPPDIALQNPHLITGFPFFVLPELEKIIVMVDVDGNEAFKPMLIPIYGGYPVPIFEDQFLDQRAYLMECDRENSIIYFSTQSLVKPIHRTYRANLQTEELIFIAESEWGAYFSGASSDHNKVIVIDSYTVGDHVGFLWQNEKNDVRLLFGIPLEQRQKNQLIQPNSITETFFTRNDGVLFTTSLFDDNYGLGYFSLTNPEKIEKIEIDGLLHSGFGELEEIRHSKKNQYIIKFNIDGCTWLYESLFNDVDRRMEVNSLICGQGQLSAGVVEEYNYDKYSDQYILSFSTAISPTQIYTVGGIDRKEIKQHTNEKILGLSPQLLSPGEDASFTTYDGKRVSARLYLPSKELNFEPPFPLVYYIHGGPQDQERPDFSWFSMPLIQILALNGFAVFVPNVRGSTGYGLNYMKEVDRDWGGKDRLDHVYALQEVLPQNESLDTSRAGVVGRSYGGYMTLTLAARHPELWSAAVDMFGPYDLISFSERIPETWKSYFSIALGDPKEDKDFLIERSPKTYIHDLSSPLLVIQGKNDPRVVEPESRELVEELLERGKDIDYLMFENEGHDILKFENRVTCYNSILDFFRTHLMNKHD